MGHYKFLYCVYYMNDVIAMFARSQTIATPQPELATPGRRGTGCRIVRAGDLGENRGTLLWHWHTDGPGANGNRQLWQSRHSRQLGQCHVCAAPSYSCRAASARPLCSGVAHAAMTALHRSAKSALFKSELRPRLPMASSSARSRRAAAAWRFRAVAGRDESDAIWVGQASLTSDNEPKELRNACAQVVVRWPCCQAHAC